MCDCDCPQYKSQFVNKDNIVSGTRSDDSVTLRLSPPRMLTGRCKAFVSFFYIFDFICRKGSSLQDLLCHIFLFHSHAPYIPLRDFHPPSYMSSLPRAGTSMFRPVSLRTFAPSSLEHPAATSILSTSPYSFYLNRFSEVLILRRVFLRYS